MLENCSIISFGFEYVDDDFDFFDIAKDRWCKGSSGISLLFDFVLDEEDDDDEDEALLMRSITLTLLLLLVLLW